MTETRRMPPGGSSREVPGASSAPARKAGRRRNGVESAVILLLLLLIGAVLLGGGMVFFSSFLTVEEVAVSGVSEIDAVLAAAAIGPEEKLYAVDAAGVRAAVLRANPYIEDVEVKRVLPDRIELVCHPREASYYIETAGVYSALSTNLCVLEQAETPDGFVERGLVYLMLPEIKSAVVTRPLVFADGVDPAYLTDLLAVHRTSGLYADTDLLRADSRFDVRLIVRGNFALTLGESADAELKLSLAERILQDSTFAGPSGAFLDLQNPAQSTAILDKQTDYTLLWRD